MPVSRSFVDLNIAFGEHPVTNDLLVTKNEEAIKRSIYNLILTTPGERLFNPNIGCKVSNLLFDPLDFVTAGMIQGEIEYTIKSFERRVNLKSVDVEIDYDNNAFVVNIDYTIIGQPVTNQQLELILESTRA